MVTGINQDNLLRQWQQRQATGYNNVGTLGGGISSGGGITGSLGGTPNPTAGQRSGPINQDNPFGSFQYGATATPGQTSRTGGTPDPTAGMPQAGGWNSLGSTGQRTYSGEAQSRYNAVQQQYMQEARAAEARGASQQELAAIQARYAPQLTRLGQEIEYARSRTGYGATGGTFDPTAGQVWQGIGQSSGPGGQRAGGYGSAPTSSGPLGGSIGGGGITGSLSYPQQQQMAGGMAYDPSQNVRIDPITGQQVFITPQQQQLYAGMTGYTPWGSPTYGREQWQAAQMGMLGGQQTLAGRQQTLSEQLGLGNLGIASAAQRLDELVRTGQLSIQQRNQALQELQNRQQYGLQQGGLTGYYGGQQTLEGELGRGNLDLARTQADRDWYYRQADLLSRPENFAMTAALRGAAPWQAALQGVQPNDPQGMGQDPAREVARRSAPNLMQRLTASERGAFGSALRAGGTTTEDYQEQVRRYTPTSSQFRTGGFR